MLVVKVVVVTLAHGSGTQLPSPPTSMPPAAAHSLGFWGSQSNGAPATGRQQLMSCGGVSSGAQPCSTASHALANELTQALPPAGAAHCIAACISSLESPPVASAFTAWLTQRR